MTRKQEGTITAQILSQGRIQQLTADANEQGHLRGYTRAPDLNFPLTKAERESGRRNLSTCVMPGQLSVVRRGPKGEYIQSAVDLLSGEVDLDIERYLDTSDQVTTVLAADVLMEKGNIQIAGGMLIQALPDGDRVRLEEIREMLRKDFPDLLRQGIDPQIMLRQVQHDAEVVEAPVIMQWKCRCSHDRVVRSMQMLAVTDLAEMIEAGEPTEVGCDFCAHTYAVQVSELQDVFELLAKAKA